MTATEQSWTSTGRVCISVINRSLCSLGVRDIKPGILEPIPVLLETTCSIQTLNKKHPRLPLGFYPVTSHGFSVVTKGTIWKRRCGRYPAREGQLRWSARWVDPAGVPFRIGNELFISPPNCLTGSFPENLLGYCIHLFRCSVSYFVFRKF